MGNSSDIVRAIRVAALCFGLFAVSGTGSAPLQQAAEPEILTIGYLNGGGAVDAQIMTGIRRAIEGVSSEPGLTKQEIKLFVFDPSAPWRDMGSQLARALFENKISALIGPTGWTEAHVAAQISTRTRIPLITLAGEDDLTQIFDPWIFRGIPSDSEQAKHLLRWCNEQSVTQTALAIIPEGRAGRERTKALRKAGRDLGVSLTFTSFANDAEKGTDSKAEAVLLWLDPGDAVRWIQRAGDDFQPKFLLGSLRLIHPEVLAAASRSGLSIFVPCLGKGPNDNRGKETPWEATGFDMAGAIIQAARLESSRPGGIRDGLLKRGRINGRTGSFQFGPAGNRKGDISITAIQHGRLLHVSESNESEPVNQPNLP